jgi:hypothetical protein
MNEMICKKLQLVQQLLVFIYDECSLNLLVFILSHATEFETHVKTNCMHVARTHHHLRMLIKWQWIYIDLQVISDKLLEVYKWNINFMTRWVKIYM